VFALAKIARSLLSPVPLLFVALLVLAWRARGERVGRGLALLSAALWLLGASLPVEGALRAWESLSPPVRAAALAPADVILVLGGSSKSPRGEGDLFEWTEAADRPLAALYLYELGLAPTILLSGGSGDWLERDEPEAPRLAAWLVQRGVPQSAIRIEDTSRNTFENARASAELLRADQTPRVILVTSAFHMPRALATLKRAGVDARPYPVDYRAEPLRLHPSLLFPNVHGLRDSSLLLREWGAWLAYRLRGRL
jgi:uncharacterized SAM-binding protein YcdF (DUF218 family)